MGEPLRSTARFPGLPLSAGHYESFYLKASHPAEPVSVPEVMPSKCTTVAIGW